MRERGCKEYESLSRRGLLTGSLGVVLQSIAPAWVPDVTYNSDYKPGRRDVTKDVIVSIYLRGGCDGLSVCVPYMEAAYYNSRSSIAIPRPDQTTNPNRAIDLNGFFGIPQSMQGIKEIYDAGDFLFVHATGSMDPTRSHFDAQQFMEAGKPDKGMWTGWLGRHLATSAEMKSGAMLRAVGLSGMLALTLQGAPKTTAIPDLANANLGGSDATSAKRLQYLTALYSDAEAALADAATNTLRTVDLLKAINFSGYVPENGAVYNPAMPGGGTPYGAAIDFGNTIKAAAALIKQEVGVEAVHIDYGGWDSHEGQDPLNDYGMMMMLMWSLSTNLRAFYLDMEARGLMSKITVLVVSEFGRTVAQNGTNGTDHGHGNVAMLMGKNVNGGQVMTQWPGLDPSQLFEGNALKTTIDYRDLVAEIVQKRLKNNNLSTVLPAYTPTVRNAVSG